MNKVMNHLIIVLILCSTLFFSGCIDEQNGNENNTATMLSEIDSSTITKVIIVNGMSGKSFTLDNKDRIKELISQLNRFSLEMMDDQEPWVGYRYYMDFYSGSEEITRITILGKDLVNVDGVYYEVDNSSVDIEAIERIIGSSSNSELASGNEGLNIEVSGVSESLSIEELNSQADIIVTGTVTGVFPSRWNTPDGKRPNKSDSELNIGTEDMIYTSVVIHVNRYIKNALDCQDLQITVEGGIVGEDSIWVEDSPSFEYVENVLLFLNWTPGRKRMTVTGEYQGKFTMINDTAAVRTDGESAVIVEENGDWVVTSM